MICWSCERATQARAALCRHAGRCSRRRPKADYFDVFGVDRRFDVDLAALEARYRELSRKLHPDRFATADPRARRASLQRSVQLNEAWRTLKDPFRARSICWRWSGVSAGQGRAAARC